MEIKFINSAHDTRSGFKHVSEVYIDGQHVITQEARYLNRTWEAYAFQSVMKSALQTLIDSRQKELIEEYRRTNGVKRVSQYVKAGLIDGYMRELMDRRNAL